MANDRDPLAIEKEKIMRLAAKTKTPSYVLIGMLTFFGFRFIGRDIFEQ